MKKYRKNSVEVDAVQWFKGVDVPGANIIVLDKETFGDEKCKGCGKPLSEHAELEAPEENDIIHPGDYIVKFPSGFFVSFSQEDFKKKFKPIESPAIKQQPAPKQSGYPTIHDEVAEDIRLRKELGKQKYGTELQPFNGRNPLIDAYQEVLDLSVYLRQMITEMQSLKNVEDIVRWFLKNMGYDGLYNEIGVCACLVNDLAPCGEIQGTCQPGYLDDCHCGEHDWHIVGKRDE